MAKSYTVERAENIFEYKEIADSGSPCQLGTSIQGGGIGGGRAKTRKGEDTPHYYPKCQTLTPETCVCPETGNRL